MLGHGSDRIAMTTDTGPELSAILISYRNIATIERAARSLLEQDTSRAYEIILVASGGDGSGELVSTRFPTVNVIEVAERLTPGAARNIGVSKARGDVIAFLAADCLADRRWVEARIDAHERGYAAVAGAVTNGARGGWSWAGHYALFARRLPGWPSRVVRFPDPSAHSLSYRRETLTDLGAFPEDLSVAEDTEMARRLWKANVPIWFDNRVRIAHLGREGRDVLADQRARGVRLGKEEGLHISRNSNILAYATFVRLAITRVAWVTIGAWRGGAGERRRLTIVLPLLWACAITYQVGWLSAQFQSRNAPPLSDEHDRLFTSVREERVSIMQRVRSWRRRRAAPPAEPEGD
jgi:glycosyltransferase involved in cell wall biosynthesis